VSSNWYSSGCERGSIPSPRASSSFSRFIVAGRVLLTL
jgi:hypothetical protein